MTTKSRLDRLVRIAPPIINATTKPGAHCVLATAVGQMVLAELGIEAAPYAVELTVCNRAWVEWAEAGLSGGPREQVRRGAYIITNTPNWKGQSFKTLNTPHPWDGHLVLRVPDEATEWLVDLNLGAFNRAQHAILLPEGVVAPLTNGIVAGTFTDGTARTSVRYEPLEAPHADDYQTARDWVERGRYADTVAQLVRKMTPTKKAAAGR